MAGMTSRQLRALRLRAGLTQKDLASRLGMATAYYASVERGETPGGVRAVVALAATHVAVCLHPKRRTSR